jgi:hypothetical protein
MEGNVYDLTKIASRKFPGGTEENDENGESI